MKYLLALLTTVGSCASLFAQPVDSLWSRTFGGSGLEECVSVQLSSDGEYALGGWTESWGGGNLSNFWLVKTDANGNNLWSHRYGGNAACHCTSMAQTSDGGYVLAGWSPWGGAGDWNFWLVRTNANGDSLWSRAYGGGYADQCESVQPTSDGGFILAGGTFSFGAGDWDFWLVKTDANGDSLWSRTYGGIYEDYCTTVRQTSDGGYVLAGWTDPSGAGVYDFFMVKTDANGDSLWSRTYGTVDIDWCRTVRQTSDGGYILGGFTMPTSLVPTHALLVRANSDGDSIWSRTYGGDSFESCTDILQTSDEGFVFTGLTWSYGAGHDDLWLVRTDPNGDSLWSRTFGGGDQDYGLALEATPDGGYILGGTTRSFGAGEFDAWLVKTAPELDANPSFIRPPSSFFLSAFPNPFNPVTTLSFSLPQSRMTNVGIYDVNGRETQILHEGHLEPGEHSIVFDASALPSGIYFARVQAGEFVKTQKLLLLK